MRFDKNKQGTLDAKELAEMMQHFAGQLRMRAARPSTLHSAAASAEPVLPVSACRGEEGGGGEGGREQGRHTTTERVMNGVQYP